MSIPREGFCFSVRIPWGRGQCPHLQQLRAKVQPCGHPEPQSTSTTSFLGKMHMASMTPTCSVCLLLLLQGPEQGMNRGISRGFSFSAVLFLAPVTWRTPTQPAKLYSYTSFSRKPTWSPNALFRQPLETRNWGFFLLSLLRALDWGWDIAGHQYKVS